MTEWIALPEKVQRGKAVKDRSKTRGWTLVTPGKKYGFKATLVSYFGTQSEDPYVVFRIRWPKAN